METKRFASMPSDWKVVISDNGNLSRYLQSLVSAQSPTERSWLYENTDAREVLESWIAILKRVLKKHPQGNEIIQFDLSQREKFGLQGGHPPAPTSYDKAAGFWAQYDRSPIDLVVLPSLAEIFPRLKGSVRKRQFDAVIDDMRARDTLNTNSGWQLFARRDIASVKQQALDDAESGAAYSYPAILLFRQYNGKLRPVWMYPFSMNLLEFQITQPLQSALTNATPYVTPWLGFEEVKRRFTSLWEQHPYAFGGDTTAMDANMKVPQIRAVDDAIRPILHSSAIKQCHDTLHRMSTIPLIAGPDQVLFGAHGVASGSGWTQLSETIFQICMLAQYQRAHGMPIDTSLGMGIGDDYVWFFDHQPSTEEIVRFWEDRGLPGNVLKQSNDSNKCTFLQRLFIKGYMSREDSSVLGGIYPTIRALNSLLHPERFHNPKYWNSDMFCIRVYQILENTVDHPAFEDFVRFVVAGQKDLIPFAKKSARELSRLQSTARAKLPGLVPTYNQEKKNKPLSSYSSIQLAKSL